jgi:hypothetical protein
MTESELEAPVVVKAEEPAVLSAEQLHLSIRVGGIFTPYARRTVDARYPSRDGSARFVHYTSAPAAIKIIRSKRLWMRNSTCMADYREVNHGYDILYRLFADERLRIDFISSLDACSSGVATEAINVFNLHWRHIQSDTYISSMSEHDEAEDLHGRLSMWRAFSPSTPRVAFVISVPWFSGAAQALKLIFSPVGYLTEAQARDELNLVIQTIKGEIDFLRTVDRQMLLNSVFSMLLAAVTCMKHEGFREEREWRAIYAPRVLGASSLMEQSIEVIDGVPQRVHLIPLDSSRSSAIEGLDFVRIFDRLIIGPSQFPLSMRDAFVEALGKAGVSDAGKRVFASQIPLRT